MSNIRFISIERVRKGIRVFIYRKLGFSFVCDFEFFLFFLRIIIVYFSSFWFYL